MATTVYSQKEYHNWYFGDSAGVTFNTPDEEPIYLDGNGSPPNGGSLFNGTSIISNSEGNLKFYFRNGRFFSSSRELHNVDDIFSNGFEITSRRNTWQGSVLLNIEQNKFMMINHTSRDAVYYSIFEEDLENDSITILKNERILRNYESDNLLVIRDFNSNSFFLLLHNKFNNNNRLGEYILFKFNTDSYEFEEKQRVD